MQTTSDASWFNHTGPISKSQAVFSLPELAATISGFCTSRDQVQLLQTSKSFFNASVRFVWERVDGANNLVLLIPGVSKSGGPRSALTLPSTAEASIFERFDLYSPYVKRLDVYEVRKLAFRLIGWKTLFSRASERTLLPTLQTLVIERSANDGEPDLLGWLIAFATSSLTRLVMTPIRSDYLPRMCYDALAYMVKLLATKCPKLKQIGLFPDEHNVVSSNNPVLADTAPERFEHYLVGLAHLERVTGSMNLLSHESVHALGRLPALVHLSMYGTYDTIQVCSEIDLDLFPALRSLLLHGLPLLVTLRVMQTAAITKNLTSLHMWFRVWTFADGSEPDRALLQHQFFPLLLNAPKLVELKIDLELGERYDIALDAATLDILAKLPLRIIELTRIRFIDECLDSSFAARFPLVTSFVMPNQIVELRQLSLFAALPRIQRLQLAFVLDINAIPPPKDWNWSTLDEFEVTVLESSPLSYLPSSDEDFGLVVRGLFTIFPNLTRIDWAGPKPSTSYEEQRLELLRRLNEYLTALAEIRAVERVSRARAL